LFEEKAMHETLATLLLLTSAVALCAIVVDVAVITSEQALQPSDSPQMERIQDLARQLQNFTDNLFNQTMIGVPGENVSP
jgi:flagellar basal body-associated protein FliL